MHCQSSFCSLSDFVLVFQRESLRVQHGQMYDFSISVERNLGEVEIVQVHWLYDHEVDPFDLTKICFLFCSDRLYTDKLVLTTVKHSAKRCCSFTIFECDCIWEFMSSVFSRC